MHKPYVQVTPGSCNNVNLARLHELTSEGPELSTDDSPHFREQFF